MWYSGAAVVREALRDRPLVETSDGVALAVPLPGREGVPELLERLQRLG